MEKEFRKRMLDKFAEDDKIEQMNAQKKRMKELEHRKEVDFFKKYCFFFNKILYFNNN